MAWSAPMTAVAGAVFTAAQFNQYVRDNLNELAVAKATQVSSLFASTGPNAIVERVPTAAFTAGSSTTAATAYGNLADAVTTSVTVAHGTRAFVSVFSHFASSVAGNRSHVGFEISGSTVVAAGDSKSINTILTGSTRFGASWTQIDMTAGTSTFTLRYRVTAGTGTFSNRRIAVIPF